MSTPNVASTSGERTSSSREPARAAFESIAHVSGPTRLGRPSNAPPPSAEQGPFRVAALVTSFEDGLPVKGARIKVLKRKNEEVGEGTTDLAGRCVVEGIEDKGLFTLRVVEHPALGPNASGEPVEACVDADASSGVRPTAAEIVVGGGAFEVWLQRDPEDPKIKETKFALQTRDKSYREERTPDDDTKQGDDCLTLRFEVKDANAIHDLYEIPDEGKTIRILGGFRPASLVRAVNGRRIAFVRGREVQVCIDGDPVQSPWVCLFVERLGEDGKMHTFKYHTDDDGRLCRFTADEPHVRVRMFSHIPYQGRFVGDAAVKSVERKHLELLEVKADTEEDCLAFHATSGAAPRFQPVAFADLAEDAAKKLLGGSKASATSYVDYLKTVAQLFGERILTCEKSQKKDEGDYRGPQLPTSQTSDPIFPGIAWQNVFFRSSDARSAEELRDRQPPRTRFQQELWTFKAPLSADVSYDHDAVVRDLQSFFKNAVREGGGQARGQIQQVARRQAATKLLATDHRDQGSTFDTLTDWVSRGRTPEDADREAARQLFYGSSSKGFGNAVASAMASAAKAYLFSVISKHESTDKTIVAKEGGNEFERLVAGTLFTFGEASSFCNFDLVPIRKRVEAWWRSLPKKQRTRLRGGRVNVDGYTSDKGGQSDNATLSVRRREAVVDAIRACLAADQIGAVTFTGEGRGTARPDGFWDRTSVEVYEDTEIVQIEALSTEKNEWRNRNASVQLYEKLRILPSEGGGTVTHVVEEEYLAASMPVHKASIVALVRAGGQFHAWVLVTPGKMG